ncbi:hypothetical protein Nepgr_020625 [Nepenthes gracilis]|uniref:Translocator protein n=1 Tax=Nepenthes gracilis TaxID=150966 RepID=A0AAD3SXY8_NEPGR|nr:hypothetical protein Nepgr_020625 [Nepenthes gracilis]
MATAKNAVRSLILYLLSNLSLTLSIVVLFGSGRRYRALQNKPVWFPPFWLIHSATLASSFLMGLSGWLVWADGSFRRGGYYSEALPVYVAQISLGFTWHPLVLRIGAAHLGVAYCLVNLGTLVSCYVNFGKVNSVAGDLVKPCLAWAL